MKSREGGFDDEPLLENPTDEELAAFFEKKIKSEYFKRKILDGFPKSSWTRQKLRYVYSLIRVVPGDAQVLWDSFVNDYRNIYIGRSELVDHPIPAPALHEPGEHQAPVVEVDSGIREQVFIRVNKLLAASPHGAVRTVEERNRLATFYLDLKAVMKMLQEADLGSEDPNKNRLIRRLWESSSKIEDTDVKRVLVDEVLKLFPGSDINKLDIKY